MLAAIETAAREAEGLAAEQLVAFGFRTAEGGAAIATHAGIAAASFAWDSRSDGHGDGESVLCLGEAARIDGQGPQRFGVARDHARSLFESLVVLGGARPRLYGGGAFESATGSRFDAFGEASFLLPRLSLVEREGSVETTVVARAIELRAPRALEAELSGLLRARAEEPEPSLEARLVDDPRERFEGIVRRAVDAIAAGHLEKVVLSRASRVTATSPLAWSRVWSALAGQPRTTRFAVVRQGATFVGATPERLVALVGGRIETEALAGSIARSLDDEADRAALLASDKDRREHDLVVRAIVSALSAFSDDVVASSAPSVRTLLHLHHLASPISASVSEATHVLDVVAALHPTPAVSGFPRERAKTMLASLEGAPRGWYAAPIGWFDATGQGRFVVGLRSALVERDSALVFAGAGIVRGSDPRAEWEETRVKQTAMLRALGVP